MVQRKQSQHASQGLRDLEGKQKQLHKACQKLGADLHAKNPNPKTLAKDCEEICRIGHSCESSCKKIS